jgi:glutamate-ammonia-ligase adenylyltransferase
LKSSPLAEGDAIDPTRAAAGLVRWRRALATALGEDPGARLDRPDRKLTMLRIFGSTRRLAELCLKHPVAAADALTDSASSVLAEAARDLAAASGAMASGEALNALFAPVKQRADAAIGIAEISGAWTTTEATAARADLAERIIETALAALVRGAASRGEIPARRCDAAEGIFALAGGDFAHEDLAPLGPLDAAIIYDDAAFEGSAARMAERAFVRIAAEFRDAIEGRTGEHPLYALKTPFGNGVRGFGFAEAKSRVAARLADPQQSQLRAWVATARVVAGDRQSGGAFLESVDETVWNGLARKKPAEGVDGEDDPRTPFRAIADIFRLSLGASRPLFRTASARNVLERAAKSGALAPDLAARLIAGEEFAQGLMSRLQMLRGAGALSSLKPDERPALARINGFSSASLLDEAIGGAVAEAKNTLARLSQGPLAEFECYRPQGESPDDIDKLEDLGFQNGAGLAGVVDGWAGLAAGERGARFSALAPGLLTAFGETQHPDEAARLFDEILRSRGEAAGDFALLAKGGPAREGLVDAIGCFGAAVAPIARDDLASEFFEERGRETPQSGAEWLSRFAPPQSGGEALGQWRKESIARIALYAAAGDMTFAAAADALGAVNRRTLAEAFAFVQQRRDASLALYLYDGPALYRPGAALPLGLVAKGGSSDANENAAREFVEALQGLGEGFFALAPDLVRRPGGAQGALAPDAAVLKSHLQCEAPAADQVFAVRARVIAGSSDAQDAARAALRSGVAGAKRADALLRDLDRARAQRLRRDRSASEWDVDQIEGGLADVELIISTLIYKRAALRQGADDEDAATALDAAARAGAAPAEAVESLKAARAFWMRIALARALARWSDPVREPVRARFGALIARAAGVDRFALVKPLMRGYAEETNRLYAQLLLGRPHLTLAAAG